MAARSGRSGRVCAGRCELHFLLGATAPGDEPPVARARLFHDVITFDYSDRKGERIVSGDIFIDVETVADNARQYGCTTLQEMRRVIVHGVLHLCGQGDKTPRTNAQMHRKEDKYLKFWETAQ